MKGYTECAYTYIHKTWPIYLNQSPWHPKRVKCAEIEGNFRTIDGYLLNLNFINYPYGVNLINHLKKNIAVI